ncbi:SSI family serine proteinase inhibitor [Streptomyces sp. CB02261]|uniref:SSI family serine proteinase inhibitor n=1 Tax=Streptomyces sp. CB02261 TaxID=1703940 RepID=UPI0018E92BFF|nr:SSI family serine proteinase inhibitor [Streptomyces sp. CB02261]
MAVRASVAEAVRDTSAHGWRGTENRPGKDHPHTAEACADLHAANGNFYRLPGQDTAVCANETGPVTVTADGTYKGRPVHWERTFDNDCERQLATGLVYEF